MGLFIKPFQIIFYNFIMVEIKFKGFEFSCVFLGNALFNK